MKFTLAIAAAAFAAPALAEHITTTVTAPPCPSSTVSTPDIVTRSPVVMASASTPCPTLYTVKTNGTVTMSAGGSGMAGGMTATATPSSFMGAAANNKAAFGGAFAAAAGFVAFIL